MLCLSVREVSIYFLFWRRRAAMPSFQGKLLTPRSCKRKQHFLAKFRSDWFYRACLFRFFFGLLRYTSFVSTTLEQPDDNAMMIPYIIIERERIMWGHCILKERPTLIQCICPPTIFLCAVGRTAACLGTLGATGCGVFRCRAGNE